MFYKLIAKIVSHPRVFKYLLNRAKKTPFTHIYGKNSELYMERYWLFNPFYEVEGRTKFDRFPLAFRIHKIVKEDDDRHLHDHPWNCRTFILKGWYREEREDVFGTLLRCAGDTAKLDFDEYHKIVDVCDDGAYTMFVTGKYQGTWGFLVDGIKVKYREYLGLGPKKEP